MSDMEFNDKESNNANYDEYFDFVDKKMVGSEDDPLFTLPLKLDEISLKDLESADAN